MAERGQLAAYSCGGSRGFGLSSPRSLLSRACGTDDAATISRAGRAVVMRRMRRRSFGFERLGLEDERHRAGVLDRREREPGNRSRHRRHEDDGAKQ